MTKPTILLSALGLTTIGLLVGRSSTAVHYKQRVADLQQKLAHTERLVTAPATLEPVAIPEPVATADERTVRPATSDLEEELARLRRKVTSQDALIVSLRQQAQAAIQEQTAEEEKPEESHRWQDRGAWMEELKTSDPEQYAEIMARREEVRLRVNDALSAKSDFLSARDTVGMTEEAQEAYVYMLNLLEETWALADQMNASELPWEDRRAARLQVRSNMRELGPMLDEERRVEFRELGLSLGYDEQGARDFSQYLDSVFEATSMGNVWRALGRSWRQERSAATPDSAAGHQAVP